MVTLDAMCAVLRRAPRTLSLGLLSLAVSMTVLARQSWPCTIVVASGRATVDGRPLLWKNRDASERANRAIHFEGEGRWCVAIINAGDEDRVWMGANTDGFCIVNSLVSDLPRGSTRGPGNGRFMKRALQTCATVADFEALLEETNRSGRRTLANFGVIDAENGAAVFEAGHATFTAFHANDPRQSPNGLLVRSNFSFTGSGTPSEELTGTPKEINAQLRYRRARRLCDTILSEGKLSVESLLWRFARDVPLAAPDKAAPSEAAPGVSLPPVSLSRLTTVSAAVFQGVQSGEPGSLTTMWTVLGDPAVSLAAPCWPGVPLAETLVENPSPLCEAAWRLRAPRDEDAPRWRQAIGSIWKETRTLEKTIALQTTQALTAWRTDGFDALEAQRLHATCCKLAVAALAKLAAPATD